MDEDRLMRWQVGADVAIAGFTFVLLAVSGFQGWLLKQSVDLARNTSEKQLRAYIVCAGGEMNDARELNTSLTITAKNTGQTPAREVTMLTQFTIRDPGWNGPFELDSEAASMSVLGPGMELENSKTFEVPEEMRKLLAEGKKVIWIWGTVRYKDVFGVDRYTNFRFLEGGANGFHAGTALTFSTEGNDAN
jgi:hypothetical protein